MTAAPDELRSAPRTFRAGLAGAYLGEPAMLEASFRAAISTEHHTETQRGKERAQRTLQLFLLFPLWLCVRPICFIHPFEPHAPHRDLRP